MAVNASSRNLITQIMAVCAVAMNDSTKLTRSYESGCKKLEFVIATEVDLRWRFTTLTVSFLIFRSAHTPFRRNRFGISPLRTMRCLVKI